MVIPGGEAVDHHGLVAEPSQSLVPALVETGRLATIGVRMLAGAGRLRSDWAWIAWQHRSSGQWA
jgi:hypothetical protein